MTVTPAALLAGEVTSLRLALEEAVDVLADCPHDCPHVLDALARLNQVPALEPRGQRQAASWMARHDR